MSDRALHVLVHDDPFSQQRARVCVWPLGLLVQVPDMCQIRPFVDLASGTLTVTAPGMPDLVLPLGYSGGEGGVGGGGDREGTSNGVRETEPCCLRSPPSSSSSTSCGGVVDCRSGDNGGGGDSGSGAGDARCWSGGRGDTVVRVCGNRRAGVTCSASASAWFTRFLGVPCSLVRAAAIGGNAATAVTTSATAAGGGGDWSSHNLANSPPPRTKADNAGDRAMKTVMPWFPAAVGLLGGWRSSSSSSSSPAPAAEGGIGGGAEDAAASNRAFANEAQFLLISRSSVAKVNDIIRRESGSGSGTDGVEEDGGDGGGVAPRRRGGSRQEQVRVRFFCELLGSVWVESDTCTNTRKKRNYTSLSRGYDTPHIADGKQENMFQYRQRTARFFSPRHVHGCTGTSNLDTSLLRLETDPQQSP